MSENNAITLIINDLKTIGCCDCCVLRYLNVRNLFQLLNPSKAIKDLTGNANETDFIPHTKAKKMNPCTSCLGLLQESEREIQINKIVTEVKQAAYDASDISFALSLPIAIQLRNYSTWLHIKDKFSSYFVDNQRFYDIYASNDNLKADNNVISLKEAWKFLFGPTLSDRIGKLQKDGVDYQFIVNIHYNYADDDKETTCIASMHPDMFGDRIKQKRKYHNEVFTRKSVEQALEKTDRQLFEAHSCIPAQVPSTFIECSHVVCAHESLYIAGRYNKYSRSLSQTPWMINGERRMESSVEEIIRLPFVERIPHDVIKFSSSGREDVDVRMLGRGRPFVLDIQNPRVTRLTFNELRELESRINTSTTSICVRDLQIIPKEQLAHIKSGEQTKTKTYDCFCVAAKTTNITVPSFEEKIEALAGIESFVIQQRTPMRVLHRRPLAVRPRTVHWIKGRFLHSDERNFFFKLSVKVEAGTYVKELVHGDLGRTVPNLSSMLNVEADILALDVGEIDLEWPPPVCTEESSIK